MEYVEFGRTGLRVSKVGLGCGGHSRLGRAYGLSESESVGVVRWAIEHGINYIDTAYSYGTEAIVGQAIRAFDRSALVLSTKVRLDEIVREGRDAEEWITQSLDTSLERLGTDYIDVYHAHGVQVEDLATLRDRLLPVMQRLQAQGRIRFLAISERFAVDTAHEMYRRCPVLDAFDVAMIGFNLLNQSARDAVIPQLRSSGAGIEVMFAVRRALCHPDRFRPLVEQLCDEGVLHREMFQHRDPVEFVFGAADADTMMATAYRYAAHEPGLHTVLCGTGRIEHLEKNINWIRQGPLDDETLERIHALFGRVDSISGN